MYLVSRQIKGHRYWYLREKAKVGGTWKISHEEYVGSDAQLVERLRSRTLDLRSVQVHTETFGELAAILDADQDLGLSETITRITGSPITAQTLLAFLAGRAHEPVSKRGMRGWYGRSALRYLRPNRPSLSSRAYLYHMDKLSDERVEAITYALGQRMAGNGYTPSLVFFDSTNFSTEQDPRPGDPERQLPRAGHAKDGNRQAKLVGLATATTEQHLPAFHRVYPGNKNDARLFREVIGGMVGTLVKLGAKAENLCFVFDKGMNSKPGWAALTGAKVHFLTSVKRSQVADLMSLPLTKFRKAYATKQEEEIRTYRQERRVMGVKGVVVVAYNESARKRQVEDYARAKARFLTEGGKIVESSGKRHRGRPPTVAGTTRRIIALIPEKWVKVFRFHVGPTLDEGFPRLKVRVWVDERAEREKEEGFGRTVIFTDREDWDDERIARTYYARSEMEEDYHVLKDVLLFPVMPILHRKDRRVKVHAFLCVMGLLIYRWIQLKVEKATKRHVPMGALIQRLRSIRLAALRQESREGVVFKLEEGADPELLEALKITARVPS